MENNKEKNVPNHIGIIPDGNRRWARERNLPTFEGHRRGLEKIHMFPQWFFARGVKIVSVFGFSTENWSRAQDEVNYLMKLFKETIDTELENANEKGYRVVVSGRIDELPGDLPEAIINLMNVTKANTKGMLNILLNYGGRPELVDAVRKMIKNKITEEQVHEGMIGKYLYNSEVMTDPDIIVRTSGEMRISGFMLWHSAYSEFYFFKKHWPDFEDADADAILREFAERKRRFGGDGEEKSSKLKV
jgi:undecaprenyl diphosphate synthase